MSAAEGIALWLCWNILTLTAAKIKNPTHGLIFTSQEVMSGVLSNVSFAPGLLDAFQAPIPPTLAFFKSLPTADEGIFAIYLIVLEKLGFLPKIYVGSGLDKAMGVRPRLRQYKTGKRATPNVKKALSDGFVITHKGILCSAPIPSSETRFQLRALFLILESLCTFTLWAMHSKTATYGMPDLCPWPINDLGYDGCCSHTPLQECIPGEYDGLTPEQIAIKEAELDARRRESEQLSQQKYRAKIRANDWMRKRRNTTNRRTTARTVASKRFWCDLCSQGFQSQGALNIHKTRQVHLSKLPGATPKVYKHPGQKRRADAIKAAKTHYCALCDQACESGRALETHIQGRDHRLKVDSEST